MRLGSDTAGERTERVSRLAAGRPAASSADGGGEGDRGRRGHQPATARRRRTGSRRAPTAGSAARIVVCEPEAGEVLAQRGVEPAQRAEQHAADQHRLAAARSRSSAARATSSTMPASTHSSTSGNGCQGALGRSVGYGHPPEIFTTHQPMSIPSRPGARADVVGACSRAGRGRRSEPPPPVGGRVGEHPLELACGLRLPLLLLGRCRGERGRRARRGASRTRSSSPSVSRRGPASAGAGGPGVEPADRRRRTGVACSRSSRAIWARSVARAARSSPRSIAARISSIAAIAWPGGASTGQPANRAASPCSLAMPRNDPTDTGGLFIGRRPGTGPLKYRAAPGARRRGPPAGRRRAGRGGARAHRAAVPDAVGPAAGGVAVGRLAGRLPDRVGDRRDRGRVRRHDRRR